MASRRRREPHDLSRYIFKCLRCTTNRMYILLQGGNRGATRTKRETSREPLSTFISVKKNSEKSRPRPVGFILQF